MKNSISKSDIDLILENQKIMFIVSVSSYEETYAAGYFIDSNGKKHIYKLNDRQPFRSIGETYEYLLKHYDEFETKDYFDDITLKKCVRHVFVSENEAVTANQICDEIIYYKMKEGKAICKDITKSITQFDSDESHFYVNDAEVGEAELNNIEEKYGLLKMSTVSYSDSVHVMNGQVDEVYKAYNNK